MVNAYNDTASAIVILPSGTLTIAKILNKPKSTVIDKVNKLKPIVQEFLDNIIY